MTEREQLEHAIAALEGQRALLGDAVVSMAVAPLRQKLLTLIADPQALVRRQGVEQRKQVTLLVADVANFTAISSAMDAEEVRDRMDGLWARVDTLIRAHEGTIDKHLGDGIIALFGTPTAREDDPERAIRAALAIQSELATMQAAQAQQGDPTPPLRMRIGIHTGLVLLGVVGSKGEQAVIGDTVNLAARLEQAAPVGGVLISHESYRHVRGVFDVLLQEPLPIRGRAHPMPTYLVERAKPRAFRLGMRGVEGVETALVGREGEMQTLKRTLREMLASRNLQTLLVLGDAGLGKSRLLYELTAWLELLPDRMRVLKARASAGMAQRPYALLRDMFAFRFEILESDRAAVARRKLEQGFATMSNQHPESRQWAAFIGHLLGLDFSASPYLRDILEDTKQIRQRAFHYASQLFAVASHRLPTVMLLDDLHWADEGSLEFLEHLLSHSQAIPLFVLGLARPTLLERRPAWADTPGSLSLQPLTSQQSQQLAEDILRKAGTVPAKLGEMIAQRAEGNPFYVEELIKMLIDEKAILPGPDEWIVQPERLAAIRIPSTLTGILQARLDSLPAPERALLQRASVVGRVFWDGTLAVAGTRGQDLAPLLDGLHQKELIFRRDTSAFAGTSEYVFKHALLRDVTYESVLKRERRLYHEQVAHWLAEQAGEREAEYAAVIADHYERAEKAEPAAEWYARAAQQAASASARETAATYYRKALDLVPHPAPLPQAMETGQRDALVRRLAWYAGLAQVLHAQNRLPDALVWYEAMQRLAAAIPDEAGQAVAGNGIAGIQVYQGDMRGAVETTQQAAAHARAGGVPLEEAQSLFHRGWAYYRLGDAAAALELGERCLKLSQSIVPAAPRAVAQSYKLLGSGYTLLGQYEQVQHCNEEALAIARRLNDPSDESSMLNNLGETARLRGEFQAAADSYRHALELARSIGYDSLALVIQVNLGGALVGLGEFQAAEEQLRQALTVLGDYLSIRSELLRFLAEACLGQARTEEALAAGQEALELAQRLEDAEALGNAWRTVGRIAAHLEPEMASSAPAPTHCFRESLRICTETRMEAERARTLKAWGEYEQERGDPAQGAALLEEAARLLAGLGVV